MRLVPADKKAKELLESVSAKKSVVTAADRSKSIHQIHQERRLEERLRELPYINPFLEKIEPHARYVVLDVETTGLDYSHDRVIQYAIFDITELAAAAARGQQKYRSTLEGVKGFVNPGIPIPEDSSRIHGICDDDVRDASPFSDEIESILETIGGVDTVIVGHNIEFDMKFLNAEFVRTGHQPLRNRIVCTLRLSREKLNLERFRLIDVAHAFGIHISKAHDAENDAAVAAQVFFVLQQYDALQKKERGPVQTRGLFSRLFN